MSRFGRRDCRVHLAVQALLLSVMLLPVIAAAHELEPALRQRVNWLVAQVEAEPTNQTNRVERAWVLWDWANAVSLQGTDVPLNVPLVVATTTDAAPDTEVQANYLHAIDDYTRHLASIDRDPNAFGKLELTERGPFVAGSQQTLRTTLEVGSLGIALGGRILISNHMFGGYGTLQTSDPAAANYLEVTAQRPGVRFLVEEEPIWGPYGGFRGAQPFPSFRVAGKALRPGDQVTLTYGSRRSGGPGLGIGTHSNDGVPLPVHIDPGDGRFYQLPPATFAVSGGPPFSLHGFAPSIVAPGEEVNLSIRAEDFHYNRATGSIPSIQILLNGERWGNLSAGNETVRTLTTSFTAPGVYRFSFRSNDGVLSGVANPIWVRDKPPYRIYWGETHGHCGFAEGQGTPEGFFQFARDDARLDFVTLSEHDVWLNDGKWAYLNKVAGDFHRDNQFLVFPGYEWSAPRERGGHHNVLFRERGKNRVPTQTARTLPDLYSGLHASFKPEDVLVIPHAHQAADWTQSDAATERLIELLSSHGTFEWFAQHYLDNGFHVGFVGASDDHLGHPGYAPGQAGRGRSRGNIFQFGGLAAAVAPSRSTNEVFDALRERHTYATSGAARIILEAQLNDAPMGSQLPMRSKRTVQGRVIGTDAISRIELVHNGQVVASQEPTDSAAGGPKTLLIRFSSDSLTFVRDNPRGQRPWRGSLEVQGGRVVAARLLGTSHRTYDVAEVTAAGHVTFDVSTRGQARVIELEVDGASPGTRLRFHLEAGRETGRAPIVVRPDDRFAAADFTLPWPSRKRQRQPLPVGEWTDEVSAELMPVNASADVTFRFEHQGEVPGDWYYLRVVQRDGQMAWSSPWWVGEQAAP